MPKKIDTTFLYKDRKGEFRWKTQAPNNKIIGASTEGYKNKGDCLANAKRIGLKNIKQKQS